MKNNSYQSNRIFIATAALLMFGILFGSSSVMALGQGKPQNKKSKSAKKKEKSPQKKAKPDAKGETIRVIVGFRDCPCEDDLDCIKCCGGKINKRFKLIPAVAASVPVSELAHLLDDPRVLICEPDTEVHAHDIGQTWGVSRIGCGPVHAGTFAANAMPVRGDNVKVAVLDTGVDYTHPEISGIYKGGYDFVNNDSQPYDDHYHGTHCAGTIGAKRDGSGVVGVSPNVDLYACKVLSSSGGGNFSWVIAALDWCIDHDIDVVSLSLGSSSYPGSQVRAAFDRAYDAGLVIVSSAGNTGAGSDTVGYPAKFSTVIAVGSTTSSNSRSSFSSTGPDVEIAAPGSSILSLHPGGKYAYRSGTSMACPHVAGVAALLISAGITDSNSDGFINDDVRTALALTATDLGNSGRDHYYGYGLVDAELAVLTVYEENGGGGNGGNPPSVFNSPTKLFATSAGSTVSLSWEDNSNIESGFQIVRGHYEGDKLKWYIVKTTGPDATTADFTGMADGTYFYNVRAIKADGERTSWSNQVRVTIEEPPVFTAPTQLTGSTSGSSVSLSWDDNCNCESGFQIVRGHYANSKWNWYIVKSTGANVTTASFSGVADGRYYYHVRGIKANGEKTSWSNQLKIIVDR